MSQYDLFQVKEVEKDHSMIETRRLRIAVIFSKNINYLNEVGISEALYFCFILGRWHKIRSCR